MANLSLDRLLFDPADADDSSNLGAFVRAGSDGDLISSTNVGGKEGLDVNVINAEIDVTATDLDIRDLAFATDKVDVTGSEVSLDATTLAALENITVSATDLDIRDLAFATDKVDVTGSEVSLDAATLAALESITVSATDLDIRDLTHVSDSVKIGDGTDLLAVNADGSINVNLTDDGIADDAADSGNPFKVGGKAYAGSSALSAVTDGDRVNLATDLYRRVYINDAPNVAVQSTRVTVGATAVALPTTALSGRTRMTIQNISANSVWVGPAAVTTSGSTTGLLLGKGNSLSIEAGQGVVYYAIAVGAGNDVIVFEQA
jgi:hypothetical protein